MPLAGRGTSYTATCGVIEGALARLYGDGWPARVVRRAGFQRRVRTVRESVSAHSARPWPSGVRALRIAFGSDFHAGPTTHPRLLDLACGALAASRPDVLLLGGDFVFLEARHIDPLAARIAAIDAPLGRFAVLGNHDLWADDAYIARSLEAAGVRVLVNEEVRLAPPFDHVVVSGLDEPWVGRPDPARAFRACDAVRIALMHAPSGLVAIGDRPFDVAFCGHTHGGHIALPGGIPIVATDPLARRHSHGRFRVGRAGVPGGEGGTLLVSRGIGGIELPFRLFADPDVIACELTPK